MADSRPENGKTDQTMKAQVLYIAPTYAACSDLARRVCEASAQAADDSSLASWEIVNGMAQFLHAAAALLADNLTRQAEKVDSAA